MRTVVFEPAGDSYNLGSNSRVSVSKSFRSLVVWAFPIAAAFLAIAFVSHRSAVHFTEVSNSFGRTVEAVSLIHQIGVTIERAETAQRGYLITGEASRAQAFKDASRTLDSKLIELGRVVESPLQRESFDRLRPLVAERLKLLNRVVSLYLAKKQADAVELVRSGAGWKLMDQVRDLIFKMETTERELLIQRTAAAERAALNLRVLQILTILAAFFSVAGAALILLRQLRERRKAIVELDEAHRTAIQALEARSTFLASMSHEIRTPLHSILGMADVLSEGGSEAERIQCIQGIRRAGGVLVNLIGDILDLSKIEAGRFDLDQVPFSIRELVEESMGAVSFRAVQKGLKMGVLVDTEVPTRVQGDANRIRQVLLNLFGNAIKFTQEGRIDLQVSLQSRFDKSSRVIFTLTDTGIGISSEHQSRIFEKFRQADVSVSREYGGSGLGLTISKHLVELMGGRIGFESRLGTGSVFFFEIPLEEVDVDLSVEPLAGGAPDPRPLRILVADDVEDNRLLIQMYLKHLPYDLVFVESGEEALEVLTDRDFDLLILDMQMPGLKGDEVAQTIRRTEREHDHQPLPIVALTAFAMKEDVEKSLESGCTAHLTKPITKRNLEAAIARFAQNKPYRKRPLVRISSEIAHLIPAFLSNRRSDVERLDRTIHDRDLKTLEEQTHSFSGVTGSYGFNELSRLSRELMMFARSSEWSKVLDILGQARTYLEMVEIHYSK